jgi:hypothetical protein
MDVAAWLRGLEQYEPAFHDNGIDAKVLPKLTVEDLKDIGVTRVGDSRCRLPIRTSLNRAETAARELADAIAAALPNGDLPGVRAV